MPVRAMRYPDRASTASQTTSLQTHPNYFFAWPQTKIMASASAKSVSGDMVGNRVLFDGVSLVFGTLEALRLAIVYLCIVALTPSSSGPSERVREPKDTGIHQPD